MRSSKEMMVRSDVTEDIAFSDCSRHTVSTGKKNDSDAVGYSQSGVGQLQGSGKGMKIFVMRTECQGDSPMLLNCTSEAPT